MIRIMLARLTNHKSLKDSQGRAKWKKKLDDLFFRNFMHLSCSFKINMTLDGTQILLKSQKVSCRWHEFCYYFDLILDTHTHIHTDMDTRRKFMKHTKHMQAPTDWHTHTWKYILTPNATCWYQLSVLNWITLWYEIFLLHNRSVMLFVLKIYNFLFTPYPFLLPSGFWVKYEKTQLIKGGSSIYGLISSKIVLID